MPGPGSRAEWWRKWHRKGGEGWGICQHIGGRKWKLGGRLYPEEHLVWGEAHHPDRQEWRLLRGVFPPRPAETGRGESITGPERGTMPTWQNNTLECAFSIWNLIVSYLVNGVQNNHLSNFKFIKSRIVLCEQFSVLFYNLWWYYLIFLKNLFFFFIYDKKYY